MILILFSDLIEELRNNILSNRENLYRILNRNANIAYQKVNELAVFTGSRYNLNLQLHFPDSKKISDIDSYGTENIGIVVDKFRKTFPIPREDIKRMAIEVIGNNVQAHDAYMYEGKEGIKVILEKGRMEILPGSIHLWCKVDDEKIKKFVDWLMQNVYFR
jgi:nuclear transport factor 2 (NTF2) superfamily protein